MKALKELESKFLRHAGHSIESKGEFPFGNCIVNYVLSENYNCIDVYNPIKDTYLTNVEDYLLSLEREIEEEEEYDMWDDHGFADEADYIRYRYG